jgi:Endonuclease IV (EC 3.1.21.-)
MPFGAHMSIAGGVSKAFERGEYVACETIQIFSKNERQWQAKPYSAKEIAAFKAEQQRTNIAPVIVHASYLINLATPADELWEKSIAAFADELERCAVLGIPAIVIHPGAHTGSGAIAGLQRIVAALDRLFAAGTGADVTVLLETTAGQGTSLGGRFEHLAYVLEHVTCSQRLGICVDTCHLLAAGYDLRTAADYEATFTEFERQIGLHCIQAFHLNDSQHPLGSHIDRHTHIGQGCIGLPAFQLLVNDTRFCQLPMIIETPKGKDLREDIENLTLLRSLIAPTVC